MTMQFTSFTAFASHLVATAERMEKAQHRALESVGKMIETKAKAKISHYQPGAGPFLEWAELAESTIEDKEAAGFAPPDNPLLRTGEMRASISHTVQGNEVAIGSNNDKAVWQELGTSRIPPRSFLGSTGFENVDKIIARVGSASAVALAGVGVNNGSFDLIEAKASLLRQP